MFREVRPSTLPGERISTYSIGCRDVQALHQCLASISLSEGGWRGLVEDIRAVPPDSVVFNWECCSGCGDHAFPDSCSHCQQPGVRGGASATIQFMGFALQSGFTIMCSDF